ncbi:MAG: beta-glucosidase [Sphingobacteriales bacterium]|nr:beta-glucosidase [Sphingobacteriales bacterium]
MVTGLKIILCCSFIALLVTECSKKSGGGTTPPPPPSNYFIKSWTINGTSVTSNIINVSRTPLIKISFSAAISKSTVTSSSLTFIENGVSQVSYNISFQNSDSSILLSPVSPLNGLSNFSITVGNSVKSAQGGLISGVSSLSFLTALDSTRKFPAITDDSLLTLIQKQTFKYFWDFGHPVSGMARERNTDPNTVTSGGSGFGIMSVPVAINRGFITRAEGFTRLQTIVSFLKNTAPKFHGAFSHWMNGSTGAVIPFGPNDDGADIVETSYLMMGLLSVRQYFNGIDMAETNLRSDINALYNGVEWDWFRQNGKKVLYWNWSPNTGFAVNVPVQGWNECLITYVLAASSPAHTIDKAVYDSGYARNGAMINNNSYYNYKLPLGQAYGGPLFFSHYSFMGINPNGLSDLYANYQTQTTNHTLINYNYCKDNPKNYPGYSDSCWGLTASDIKNGYTASSPTNDVGVIAPTAAISSLPYTPTESMKAIKFFYYVLGDKIWKDYGFTDAFSLNEQWYASSFLAIDQGPEIVMIENYRTGLPWSLFTSCPEIIAGMKKLGFSAPYLN